jgi:hypothetical protein
VRIKPSSWTPPHSYEGLPVLPRPPPGRSFAALASRVALFGRDGVVDVGSRMLWHIWDHSEKLDPNELGTAIVRAGALPVIALGLMFGSAGIRPCPTEVEFRLLSWEFHNLPEFAGQDSAAARQERDEAKAKLRELPSASRLSGLPQQAAGEIRGLWVRGKVVERQLQCVGVRVSDLVRAALIYEQLRHLMGGDANANFRKLEQAYFRTDYRLFVRAALTLLGAATQAGGAGHTPGRVDIGAGDVRDEYPTDVGVDDMLIVVDILGCSVADFPRLGRELLRLPDWEVKSSPLLWQLLARPILRLDDYPGPDACIAIPSPWALLAGVPNLFLSEFVSFLKCSGAPLPVDPEGARGDAFDHYLEKSLTNVVGLARVASSNVGKRPDFLWAGDTYAVAIEAKVRVTPGSDLGLSSIRSIIEAWHRLCEAIDQASAYCAELRAQGSALERWILVVVVQEALTAELTSFRHAASRWHLLRGTGLTGLAVLTPRELEHFVLEQSADHAGRFLERRYIDAAMDGLDQPPSGADTLSESLTTHVEDGWTRLLGTPPKFATHRPP